MSQIAAMLNVPTDAPLSVYRTPNAQPSFDTQSKDVSVGGGGQTVNSPDTVGVVIGAVGEPISNGG